ncbi:hypothetical protein [Oryzifoliimicrobium ureilyticus]|uniref:hypothetical protein n=1 Tax=Oryzifoliimicrobium ureilyticus TaxID=3113724 RepID=UPI0030767556
MHLVRDLLDKQLVDSEERPIGRVDGIVINLSERGPPRVTALETGSGVVQDRFGLSTSKRRFRISYDRVRDVGIDVDVDVEVDRDALPVVRWQEWLRKNVLRWIPGGSS